MKWLAPRTAMSVGTLISSVGILVTLTHPFGRGDLLDAVQGLVVGIGFGITIAGFVKHRRHAHPPA